tara:strand:- start:129 stop:533 length:405 start_codon:yes stop_codon:yes gene_type:complete
MSKFTGGGGGAGGGANGGGGGGGGGAVKIFALDIHIAANGFIDARGGNGGEKVAPLEGCVSGSGGGGAGGMVWLEAEYLFMGGQINVDGGTGGTYESDGGDGSNGRIQISSPNLIMTGSTSSEPSIRSDLPDCP